MSSTQYKVGDLVFIKELSQREYIERCMLMFGEPCDTFGIAGFCAGMCRYQGRTAKITNILPDGDECVYEIDADDGRFYWDAAMFEDGEIVFDVDMRGVEVLI